MVKRTTKSNVIQLPKAKTSAQAKEEKIYLAQQKIYDAWESTGKRRTALAREALSIHEDCADAYLVLAADLRVGQQRIKLYRQAVKAGNKTLGKDWETKYKGVCWLAVETRPVMRAMAQLAHDLQWEDEILEALTIYRKLIDLNPNDNQGIRYLLAGCLYEAHCSFEEGYGKELEKLLATHKDDITAALKYTKALYLFHKHGRSKIADKALIEAFQTNNYVPIFLSDIIEMPEKAPATIGFGDESEAIAYVMDNCYMWGDTEGAKEWISDKLALALHEAIGQPELVTEVLNALKGIYEDDD